MKIETNSGFSSSGNFFYEKKITDNVNPGFESSEEVARIHRVFFDKPYQKQREVLRLLIWWSVKHYFKILFK